MSEPDSMWELAFSDPGPRSGAVFDDLWLGNGLFVATGVEFGDGSDLSTFYRAFIGSAPSPDGPWTTSSWTLGSGSPYARQIRALAFGDGLWVAIVCPVTTDYIIYTATDPTGTWTERATLNSSSGPWAGGGGNGFETRASVAHDGTNWAAQVNGAVFTTSDPTGSWTAGRDFWQTERYTLYGTNYPYDFRMFHVEGEWIMVFGIVVYDPTPRSVIKVFTADDAAGTWTERSSVPHEYGMGPHINLFATHEGVALSTVTATFAAPSLDGPWTRKWDWVAEYPSAFDYRFRVSYGDGYYVLTGSDGYAGRPILGVSTSLDAPFDAVEPADKENPDLNTGQRLASNAVFSGGEWAVAGEFSNPQSAGIWTPSGAGDGWGLLL